MPETPRGDRRPLSSGLDRLKEQIEAEARRAELADELKDLKAKVARKAELANYRDQSRPRVWLSWMASSTASAARSATVKAELARPSV